MREVFDVAPQFLSLQYNLLTGATEFFPEDWGSFGDMVWALRDEENQ